MINFQYYPQNTCIPKHLDDVVKIFKKNDSFFSSTPTKRLKSNEVLSVITKDLESKDYSVEKKVAGTTKFIEVPVLYGRNNILEKSFRADAYSEIHKSVIEVEAGRGVLNNQFLKDLFQACMMQNVDFLSIAVLNEYIVNQKSGVPKINTDFDEVCKFFDSLFVSDRMQLPLKGILIIGY